MHLSPLGDRAILVKLGDRVEEATRRRVLAACARLDARPVRGMVELVPGVASVAVHYDPAGFPHGLPGEVACPYERIAAELRVVLAGLGDDEPPEPRTVEIRVCYGGDAGPDLADLARYHRLTVEEVVRIHVSGDYVVQMIGFAPGFPYLGGLDPRLATPRRATPRPLVPASSVAIGGEQTGIYPLASPGGWHLIGRTPARLFHAGADPPNLLRMGDRVRFREITEEELRAEEAGA